MGRRVNSRTGSMYTCGDVWIYSTVRRIRVVMEIVAPVYPHGPLLLEVHLYRMCYPYLPLAGM